MSDSGYRVTHAREQRDPMWTERVAVGCPEFVREVQAQLGCKAWSREIVADGQAHVLYHRRPTGAF